MNGVHIQEAMGPTVAEMDRVSTHTKRITLDLGRDKREAGGRSAGRSLGENGPVFNKEGLPFGTWVELKEDLSLTLRW